VWDQESCTVIRCALMKPEHASRTSALVERLERWA
jgi:hypothetical protein